MYNLSHCANVFSFNRGVFIKDIKYCFHESFQIGCVEIHFPNILPELFIIKVFIVFITYYFWLQLLETNFKFSDCHKWKSESPVSKTLLCWKQLGWFVKIRSMHVGISGFLKHIGFLIKLVIPFKLQNSAKHFSLTEALKSPKNKKFWYSLLYSSDDVIKAFKMVW